MSETHPLEPSPRAMRAMLEEVGERLLKFVEELGQARTPNGHDTLSITEALQEPLPSTGSPFSEVLNTFFDQANRPGMNTAGPGYLAYIPGGGIFYAALSDLITHTVNRYVGIWSGAPGCVQIELTVIRWLCDMVGLGPNAGGLLLTGGSLANQTAVVTARRERLGNNHAQGQLYFSDQVHHSVRKAALLVGFAPQNLRTVASDQRGRVDLRDLRAQITSDREQGGHPFMVVGQAGSTNTGAIDDLHALADIAQEESLWLHMDAAYGGFFLLTQRGQKKLTGIERADSVTLDPHKGLFLPYGTGVLLVRDEQSLIRAHSMPADYMTDVQNDGDHVDFCDMSPELSRDFRGLRVWLPIKIVGSEAFSHELDEKLDLTLHAAQALEKMRRVVVLNEPELSIVAFRAVLPERSEEDNNTFNRRWLEGVNQRGRVYLSGTLLDGVFAIRICVLSFRTHREHIDRALEDLESVLQKLLSAEGLS